jgi:hypothetical protein
MFVDLHPQRKLLKINMGAMAVHAVVLQRKDMLPGPNTCFDFSEELRNQRIYKEVRWESRVHVLHCLLDLPAGDMDWNEVAKRANMDQYGIGHCAALIAGGFIRRMGKHLPWLPHHCLRTVHAAKDASLMERLLQSMNMNEIPQQFFEELFLKPGDKNMDEDEVGVQKGTALWYCLNASQTAAGASVWNGGALVLAKDLLTYILERVPELRVGTGASVLLTVPTGPRPNIKTDDMYLSWTHQVRVRVSMCPSIFVSKPSFITLVTTLNLPFPSNHPLSLASLRTSCSWTPAPWTSRSRHR